MRGIRESAALLVAGSAVAGVVVAVAVTDSRASFDDLVIVLAVAAYAVVGVAVELARPEHPVGRLMLVGAWAWGVGEGLLALGIAGLDESPGSVTAALIGVLGCAMRGFGWLVLVLALPLVFPDGRSPSRPATRLVWAAVAAFTVASLAAPVPLENRLATVDNPIGFPESWQLVADLLAIASLRVSWSARVSLAGRRPCSCSSARPWGRVPWPESNWRPFALGSRLLSSMSSALRKDPARTWLSAWPTTGRLVLCGRSACAARAVRPAPRHRDATRRGWRACLRARHLVCRRDASLFRAAGDSIRRGAERVTAESARPWCPWSTCPMTR